MALKDPKPQDVEPATLEGRDGRREALPPEVKRRYEAYKTGKTKPISLEELFADL
jgi:hypothetical protein